MSRTFVKLAISDAAFDEIKTKLIAGGADEYVSPDILRLDGIALVRENENKLPARNPEKGYAPGYEPPPRKRLFDRF